MEITRRPRKSTTIKSQLHVIDVHVENNDFRLPFSKRRFKHRRGVRGVAMPNRMILLAASMIVALVISLTFLRNRLSTTSSNHVEVIGDEVTLPELIKARDLLLIAKEHGISQLRKIDREKYTVRIMTWRRNEQLIASIDHLRTCPNIAQIQVVWCDKAHPPPSVLLQYSAGSVPVVVEHHGINSLNERFRVLIDTTPTYGILSVDDDVLRPCEAMDAGFYRWTDHPDRIVGYDTRLHIISTDRRVDDGQEDGTMRIDTNPLWNYGYLSSSQNMNQYSITLPRFCFIHRDYLDLYIQYAPKRILETIDEKFNCEDIGMSFFVSALTHGNVPLLADQWACMSMMVKLYSESAISGRKDHKIIRDSCVDKFGFLLGLKDGYALLEGDKGRENWGYLKAEEVMHGRGSFFGIGADIDQKRKPYQVQENFTSSRKEHVMKILQWVRDAKSLGPKLPFENKKKILIDKMRMVGFLENTPEWELKFGKIKDR